MPVGVNAELSPRQVLAYNHTASLYRPVRIYAGDNKPSVESYELAYEGVPCRFVVKQSTDLASVIGRLEGDQVDTTDEILFAEEQDVDDNWWILNQSLRPDGTEGNQFGRWWTVRGQPRLFIESERREGGRKSVKASQELNAPLGITS